MDNFLSRYTDPRYVDRAAGNGLAEMVKGFEGYSAKPFWDYKQWTSGYGTKAQPGETIDRDEADRRLQAELDRASGAVRQRWPGLDTNRVNALASFTYNLGPGWMDGSGLANAVSAGDWGGAASRMQQYVNAGGQPIDGLRGRRQAEAEMLLGRGGSASKPSGYATDIVYQNV